MRPGRGRLKADGTCGARPGTIKGELTSLTRSIAVWRIGIDQYCRDGFERGRHGGSGNRGFSDVVLYKPDKYHLTVMAVLTAFIREYSKKQYRPRWRQVVTRCG